MNRLAEAVGSFALTRWVSRKSRADFERWQAGALRRFLDRDRPRAPFYGKAPACLTDLPVTDKALLMARFDEFNIHGLTAAQAWATLAHDGRAGALTVGASTADLAQPGTSGNRGLFVDFRKREKYPLAGRTILAKEAAPDLVWRGMRVAVILPQNTGLTTAPAHRT
ncbi:hypothetical protein [Mesorhizobium sp. M2A.F.Ca.ET.043.02.1.1]|uniref:hypothetical protein n=1 Tax=Mesorhizobium sp. M2A.F.Ca.ET.043.02.1.1 TaxID=2493670 RepID=UPI001AEC8467|nr:hypothetical protein [Mesorhizobium sp. M2A.F.Ca.ET.043.02.1.1]